MSERWCKLYPNALTDPLWIAVAAEADSSRALVGQTFVELLCWATDHDPEGGSIAGFDPRIWAAWVERPAEEIGRILDALRTFGRLVGDKLANWVKRQGAVAVEAVKSVTRAISTSTDRVRRHRKRQRAGATGQLSLMLPISTANSGTQGVSSPVSSAFHGVSPAFQGAKTGEISTNCANPPEEKREETDSSDSDSRERGGLSRRCAPLERPPPGEIRVKRANLIKTLRRWARLSSRLNEDERLPRLQMLDRAELALDDWDSRSIEDKRCFDILAARARASPLDDQVISWVRKAETPQPRAGGLRPLGHVLNLSDGR